MQKCICLVEDDNNEFSIHSSLFIIDRKSFFNKITKDSKPNSYCRVECYQYLTHKISGSVDEYELSKT